jgi:HSP20 family protein
MDRMFRGFFSTESVTDEGFTPALTVAERDEAFEVVAELPGVAKEDVKLSLENDVLTISGTRKANGLPENGRWLRNEIPHGQFARSIRLPRGVKAEEISAELRNGILRVVLPKAEELKPREIKIN